MNHDRHATILATGSTCFYSLDPLTELAARLARKATRRHDFAVSADVGSDLMRSWRRPSMLILYTGTALDAADLGSVDAAGINDASVIVRMPADQSVFPARDSKRNSRAPRSRLLTRSR